MVSAVMTTRVCTPKPPYTMMVVMMRRVRSRHARHAMAVLVVPAAHGRVSVPLLLVPRAVAIVIDVLDAPAPAPGTHAETRDSGDEKDKTNDGDDDPDNGASRYDSVCAVEVVLELVVATGVDSLGQDVVCS